MRSPVDTAREIVDHVVRVARLELELKTVELRGKAIRVGVGGGLALLAVLLAPLLVAFLLAAAAAGLATVVSVWLAILIVSIVLLVLVGGLAGAAAVLISGARDAGP
jgi:putative superfamily III holin-X